MDIQLLDLEIIETSADKNLIGIYEIRNNTPGPNGMIIQDGRIFFRLKGNKAYISIFTTEGVFYHFYPDYKNYYYFPNEDIAYHKSVASFSNKSHRVKATRNTAYMKKSGLFMPLPNPSFTDTPFYEDEKRRQAHFPITPGFLSDAGKIKTCLRDFVSYYANSY